MRYKAEIFARTISNQRLMLPFVGISIVVIVTPGQDTALTIRNSLLGGRRAGIATALGVSTGQAVWALATSIGLAALIVAFEPAFVTLKLIGAAFLIYLGVQAILAALRGRPVEHRDRAPRKVRKHRASAHTSGPEHRRPRRAPSTR